MTEILTAVDLSEVTETVVAQAKKLAKAVGGKIRLVYVAAPEPAFLGYDVGPTHVRDSVAEDLRTQHRSLELLAEAIRGDGVEVEPRFVQGRTVEKLLEIAEAHPPEWIVAGSHGHGGVYETLVGSVCKSLLRHSRWPLVIVPAAAK